jgi:hypothetical protein
MLAIKPRPDVKFVKSYEKGAKEIQALSIHKQRGGNTTKGRLDGKVGEKQVKEVESGGASDSSLCRTW